jgi:regulatory protein
MNSQPQISLKSRALRLLAGRDWGRVELERKLATHAESPEQLQTALDDLQAKGFISDERAAASLLHRRADKLGTARLVQELKQKGFDANLIAAQSAFLRETEENRIQIVWEKKFGTAPQSPAEKAKHMRFLASRGFSSNAISKLMRYLPLEGEHFWEE